VLETHRQTLTPTLATKADIKGAENRMIMWAVGAALALLAAGAGLLTAAGSRTDAALSAAAARTDAALGAAAARTDAALADIRADMRTMNARSDRLDEKIDTLAARQDARMDGLDAKIERLDEKIDARFDALIAELRAQRRGGE